MKFHYRLKPDDITAQDTTQDTTMWIATWCFVYGLVTFIGGEQFWSQPSYRTALQVPYSPESWAVILMLVGIGMFTAMWIGHTRLMSYSLFFGMLWNFFFAYSFAHEYFKTSIGGGPSVGIGPTVTYAFITGIFALRISTYRKKNATKTNTP